MNDQNEIKLQQFMEITGITDRELADAMLASMNYDVERAVEQHFVPTAGGTDDDEPTIIEHPTRRTPSPDIEVAVPELRPREQHRYHAATHIIEQPSSSNVADRTRPRRTNGREPRVQPRNARNRHLIEEDDDDDMDTSAYAYAPDDDDMMDAARQNEHTIPLIPKDYGDVYEAINNFITVFDARYRNGGISSKPSPNFFHGTLPEAVQLAFDPIGKGVEDRRPLAIYLHHDRGIGANIFPPNILCSESVANLLRGQFILWPWDVTEREHQTQLRDWMAMSAMDEIFGQAIELRTRNRDLFPMLLLVTKDKGKLRISESIFGTDTLDTAVQKLMSVVDAYTQIRLSNMADEAARKERDRLREEQHKEYEASLAADRARMEAKEREIREQKEAEEMRVLAEAQEAKRRKAVEEAIPAEPGEKEPNVLHVKMRLPSGEMLMRRFRKSEKLSILLAFLDTKGFNSASYKFFNSDFPKKDVTTMDKYSTFETLKWPAREQIFVEEI